jgi:hypothetical protein
LRVLRLRLNMSFELSCLITEEYTCITKRRIKCSEYGLTMDCPLKREIICAKCKNIPFVAHIRQNTDRSTVKVVEGNKGNILRITRDTYIYIYIYIHTHIHTYVHTYIHTYIHAYIQEIHIYIHTLTYIHTHTYTYIYACIHTYIHTYIHTIYIVFECRTAQPPGEFS